MSTAFPQAKPCQQLEGIPLMKTVIGLLLTLGLILTAAPTSRAADGKLSVVAAENFYGDVVRQIGGDDVAVASVMSNPDQDPHLFETTPSTVRQIAAAQVVILNGADYDPWMDKLLKASPKVGRTAIVVADLVGKKAGDNPHLWYDPGTMPAAARALAEAFAKATPALVPITLTLSTLDMQPHVC